MKTNTFSSLSNPALIAVGSVDGVLTSAAVLRLIGRDCPILFTQAFTVDRLDISSLPTGSEIVLVDLAVNLKAPQMTVDFLRRLRAAGHHLVAIIDEHGRADWFAALAHAGDPDGDRPGLGNSTIADNPGAWGSYYEGDLHSFAGWSLIVEPQGADRNLWPSSGSVLRAVLARNTNTYHLLMMDVMSDGTLCSSPFADLLRSADAADRGDFSPPLAALVNEAVKTAIADDSRRVTIARHLAGLCDATGQIEGWRAEYRAMEAANAQALAALTVAGGIGRVDATGLRIDVTAVLMAAYSRARVVELSTTQGVSFGTGDRALDLLAIAKAAGISAGGFASKINVSHADADRAREAIVVAIGG